MLSIKGIADAEEQTNQASDSQVKQAATGGLHP
jgi:hypothetical protein